MKKFDLVVTRHKGLVEHLISKGIVDSDVEVVDRATSEVVKGKRVIGVLPLHLASLTGEFAEVTLALPLEMRGKELTCEDVELYAQCTTYYQVFKTGQDMLN